MANEAATPVKRGAGARLAWVALAVVAAGSGVALPWVLPLHGHAPAKKEHVGAKPVVVPFGDVVVNLGEERLTRYLRVKLLLVVEDAEEKEITELLVKQKAFMKSWLIGYLSDQSLAEVSRAAGVNRIRREVRDQFNAMLFPDGAEKIYEILFDEFVVQ
jgi:flagellar basal body-associated protein FliL